MIKSYDENIGLESILPNDIIDLLNLYKAKSNKCRQNYALMTNNIASYLDEHESAMAE